MKCYTQEEIRQAVQTIADAYLSMYETMRDQKTVTIADDTVIQKLRKMGFPRQGRPLDNVVGEMLEDVCTNQALLQHPRFFAFVPSPASPLSWVGDVLTDAYNPHGGTWMESSAASCLEQETIEWLCQQAGYPQTAGGLLVSGGSIANLTALAAARHAMLAETEYSSGVAYLSEQAHFSILKALRIMGLTKEQIHMIPCDDSLRMDVLQLEQAILQDKKAGKKPFLVVATAGTTNTGCIDPLSRIADICQIHRLWFHVDGAYGASALISKKYRYLLEDVARADSLVWDAHKWLFQTYACSTVLFRDRKHLAGFYSSDPEYLRDAAAENGEINYWEWGIELTRPARSLKLWLTLQTLGTDQISDMVTHGIDLAQQAESMLRNQPEWEVVTPAQLAIVNFRYAPQGLSPQQQDELNTAISQRMMEDGFACVLTTQLKGRTVLRICSIHPETTEDDIRHTIQRMDQYARALKKERVPNFS